MKDAKARQRLRRRPATPDATADVVTRGEDEGVGSKRAVARSRRGDPSILRFEGFDLSLHRAQPDRLLESPAMRRGWRRQELEAVVRKIREAWRVSHRCRPGLRQRRRPASVQVRERGRHRQVGDRHVLGERVDAVQLFQRLSRRGGVVVAAKPANNSEGSEAESVERREGAEGNTDKTRAPDTEPGMCVSGT